MSLLVNTKTARQLWVAHVEPQRGSSKTCWRCHNCPFIHRLWAPHGKKKVRRKMDFGHIKVLRFHVSFGMNFENILVQTNEWRFFSFVYIGNEFDWNLFISSTNRKEASRHATTASMRCYLTVALKQMDPSTQYQKRSWNIELKLTARA